MSVKKISNDAEWQSLPEEGFIFNQFGGKDPRRLAVDNKLHRASCRQRKMMNLAVPKLYSDNLNEMLDYLKRKVGEENKDWSRCSFCF